MVDKKRLSKRVGLKKKYTIQRRVKEHHRKEKREAKRAGKSLTSEPKLRKDPGIPNMCPFKESMMQRVEQARAQSAAYVVISSFFFLDLDCLY